jgi:hypothetical protein
VGALLCRSRSSYRALSSSDTRAPVNNSIWAARHGTSALSVRRTVRSLCSSSSDRKYSLASLTCCSLRSARGPSGARIFSYSGAALRHNRFSS